MTRAATGKKTARTTSSKDASKPRAAAKAKPGSGGSAREIMEAAFDALIRGDKQATIDAFADDAVLCDPHYPVPEMRGKEAIARGLDWGFNSLRSFGFVPVKVFESADGSSAAFEVETHHVLKNGMKIDFPQAFFVDVAEGRITSLRAYEPYGPHGIAGIILGLTRLKRRVFG
ncbi:MAG: nuclear transport factor 2 family protein [Pseudomonadota bacterium]|nr:nuclear transport factor 2 family protein [Pseudomonadota bacterium]